MFSYSLLTVEVFYDFTGGKLFGLILLTQQINLKLNKTLKLSDTGIEGYCILQNVSLACWYFWFCPFNICIH